MILPRACLITLPLLALAGCGGGSSSGPAAPTIITLGGIGFDPGQSATFPAFSASTPALTLHEYQVGLTNTTRHACAIAYSASLTSGVPGVQVVWTYTDSTSAVTETRTAIFARASTGVVYVIRYQDALPSSTPVDWTVGVAGAVAEEWIPAQAGVVASVSYPGGFFQPPPDTLTIEAVGAATPTGETTGATDIRTDIGDYWFVDGDGFVEISFPAESPAHGYAPVVPAGA
jgi:hypothetical protein